MARKCVSVLVFLTLTSGIAFTLGNTLKNTVNVDVGPVFVGLLFGQVASVIDKDAEKAKDESHGFGIAAQYERQIFDKFSVAGRFSYFWAKNYVRWVNMDLSSFSIESYGRYYPFGGMFFLDGMLGYVRLSADLSGRDQHTGEEMELANDYLKIGARLGWKIDFGKPGGFVLETSLGYCYGIRIGSDDFENMDQYSYVNVNMGPMGNKKVFTSPVERNALNGMAKYLFVSGPRMTVCLGYSF